ncbi:hypothetical protein SCYZ1_48 [Pseudomonas phage SCYZ1]|nr:hypothetical protein SCYZ1_48 [Pseudomonas phage SCYZ1]
MSASNTFVTKGYNQPVWGKILEKNVFRKAILIANNGTAAVNFGFGAESLKADSVLLRPGHIVKFDSAIPIDELWGEGYLVIGEVS